MANPIRETSKLYDELCIACEKMKLRERFDKCYTLIDNASYEEIHYVISMLKEVECTEDLDGISIGGIVDLSGIINALKIMFSSRTARSHAFLMDILEEARERKRAN